MAINGDLHVLLKPFQDRADEAEERLGRLEALIAGNRGMAPATINDELVSSLKELRNKLDKVKAEQISEREKALKENEKLASENARLRYRILHLVRALQEADSKLASQSS